MFTTAVVSYPDIVHIDENKDFTDVINKALDLEGSNGQGGGSLFQIVYVKLHLYF